MPHASLPPASATPVSPALSAFLRGIERRAFVFAQVQCGQDGPAEMALGRAMRAFRALSTLTPLSAWPAGFWSLLMAQGELSDGDSPLDELAGLSNGPRAALLLRMVAGLDFPHAAQVLGVGEDTYRFALQRALHQLGEAGVSYADLGHLRERLHRQVKTLPDERIERLAALRASVLAGEPEPAPAASAPPARWLQRALWIAVALLALGFAATFLGSAPSLPPGGSEALPDEPAVAGPVPAVASAGSEVVTHPDFSQLAHPDDEALAAELAFLSWIASGEADPLVEPAADAEAGDAP